MINIKKSKTGYALINITGRCNLQCRHCNVVGKALPVDANRNDVLCWIKDISASQDIGSVSFVGGEPFLCLDDLSEYIQYAKENGLETKVVTNGFWATSPRSVDDILNKLPGLDTVIVSSDKYHLEHIKVDTVDNLVNGCIKNDRKVVMYIAAANKEDGKEIKRFYANRYSKKISIFITPIYICEEDPQDIEIEYFNYMECPRLLRKSCKSQMNSIFINENGDVYPCSGAGTVSGTDFNEGFFYLGNLKAETYNQMIKRRGIPLLQKFMEQHGPYGLAKILSKSLLKEEFGKKGFSTDCHMCAWALNNVEFYNYIIDLLEKVNVKNN